MTDDLAEMTRDRDMWKRRADKLAELRDILIEQRDARPNITALDAHGHRICVEHHRKNAVVLPAWWEGYERVEQQLGYHADKGEREYRGELGDKPVKTTEEKLHELAAGLGSALDHRAEVITKHVARIAELESALLDATLKLHRLQGDPQT